MSINQFNKGYRFSKLLGRDSSNQTAIDAVNAFANDLAVRYNPTVGCTRSWDTTDPTDFTVCRLFCPYMRGPVQNFTRSSSTI